MRFGCRYIVRMKPRNRLIGVTLVIAALLSIGEQLWATTCAPGMPMSAPDHSSMPGMPGMSSDIAQSGQMEHSQPTDTQRSDCPLDNALVQACVMSMLIPTATMIPTSAADHVVRSSRQTSLTPPSINISSVFHPPKL